MKQGCYRRKEMCIVQWKEEGQGKRRKNREGEEEESRKVFEQKDEKKELRI